MEALNADMAQLSTGKKSSMSLLDVVGADIQGSFDRNMQTQIVSDTYHISLGGQDNVQPLSNLQINLNDDNALYYLKHSGILFDIRITDPFFVHNASALFSGLEISFGNVQVSTPLQQYLIQQKLCRKSKKELSKVARGMVMKHSEFGSTFSFRNAGGGATTYKPILWLHSNADPSVITASADANTTNMSLINRQLAENWLLSGDISVANGVQKMFVPFHYIFDCINDLPDDGAVFSGYGQRIKMNIRLNGAGDCLNTFGVVPNNVVPTYRIEKMQLVKCFSKLSQPLADNILKTNIELPLCKYVQWQQQVTTSTINAIYSVAKEDLITGLIFGFHTNTQCAVSGEDSNTLVSMTNNAVAQFKSPLSYFPVLPIVRVQISVGGELLIYDLQQLQAMHILEAVSDDQFSFDHPVLRKMKYAFRIDLRRFMDDFYGSSAKQTTTVQVQISLAEAGQAQRTLPSQTADWNAVGAEYSNFAFYSFLETLNFMELKGGVYKAK